MKLYVPRRYRWTCLAAWWQKCQGNFLRTRYNWQCWKDLKSGMQSKVQWRACSLLARLYVYHCFVRFGLWRDPGWLSHRVDTGFDVIIPKRQRIHFVYSGWESRSLASWPFLLAFHCNLTPRNYLTHSRTRTLSYFQVHSQRSRYLISWTIKWLHYQHKRDGRQLLRQNQIFGTHRQH